MENKNKEKILFIGAHPDDIELGAGGTVSRFINEGKNITFLILTNGEAAGDSKIRRKEAIESAKALGVKDIRFGNLKDSDKHVRHDRKTISIIQNVIDELNPTKIFTTTLMDGHQDHKNTALSTIAAARNSPSIFFFELPSSFPDFRPHFFVDISKEMDSKIKAIESHKSQKDKTYMDLELIKGISRFRAFQSKIKINYAEAFEIFRYTI